MHEEKSLSRGSNGGLTVTAEFGSEQSHFDHSVTHRSPQSDHQRNMSKGGSSTKSFSSSSHNTHRSTNSSFNDHAVLISYSTANLVDIFIISCSTVAVVSKPKQMSVESNVKFEQKGWSKKSLSYAGKLELIRAVIQGIVNFWMGIFPLPQSVLDRINASCRNFLWGKADIGKNKPLVAWPVVCSRKKEGGLGLFNFKDWNLALLSHILWDFHFESREVVPIPKMKTESRSKEETKTYQEWFDLADSDGDGRISGNDATNFFALSNLSRSQLKQLWALADVKRQGFLGFTEFVTAMQLVSLAQAGHELNSDILKTQIDKENIKPPVLDGLEALVAQKSLAISAPPEVNGTPQPQVFPTNRWFGSKSSKKLSLNSVTSIIDGLKRLYIERLKPLEVAYQYNDFVSPLLTNTDFDAKPMVMLLGQYSTGKTTFIKHLLKCDYPGAHVGPEPTTDRFVVVMSGPDERSIPGNTIAVDADMPFGGLTTFGGSFLSKFQCSQMPHPLLDEVTFVDTPGVLSGEKQRTQRSYDFTGVVSWFAAKCDLILLLFDPHKLDISDEFKRVIACLRGNDDKIRVVLNKADQVNTQQLMRVYGALMWSLGKVLNTPEVTRVYIGSFNDKPMDEGFVSPLGQDLFEKEQNNLLADLMDIPKKACDRRINEFVKRARSAKIHAYIISHLKKEMPAIMGKAKAQQRLLDNLEEEFAKVQREFHLPAGDFPNVEHFREVLSGYSIDKFEKLKPKMIQAVDDMLGYEIPELLKKFRNPYD
ncbi:EH domain-containing protein 2 [Glycine soja]